MCCLLSQVGSVYQATCRDITDTASFLGKGGLYSARLRMLVCYRHEQAHRPLRIATGMTENDGIRTADGQYEIFNGGIHVTGAVIIRDDRRELVIRQHNQRVNLVIFGRAGADGNFLSGFTIKIQDVDLAGRHRQNL